MSMKSRRALTLQRPQLLSDRCEHCAEQLVAVHATYLRNSEYSARAPQMSATPTPTNPSVRATCFGVMA